MEIRSTIAWWEMSISASLSSLKTFMTCISASIFPPQYWVNIILLTLYSSCLCLSLKSAMFAHLAWMHIFTKGWIFSKIYIVPVLLSILFKIKTSVQILNCPLPVSLSFIHPCLHNPMSLIFNQTPTSFPYPSSLWQTWKLVGILILPLCHCHYATLAPMQG